jgi:hypothetical protein
MVMESMAESVDETQLTRNFLIKDDDFRII